MLKVKTITLESPPAGSVWHILDVMPKGDGKADRNAWVALVIDVEPELHATGQFPATRSAWVNLGRHPSRDDAWDAAEQALATRH